MPKNFKNPTSQDDSPIKVEHHGGWDPTEYKNYVQPTEPTGHRMPVFGRPAVVHDTVYDYQQSKTEDAKIDKALDNAIQRDLKSRNIK